uniref:CheR family methyltransferase n=1 Tax=Parerythrobacter lutipelagi TaxID=1964208 RepID=UPI0010F6988C|nr:CheR family methyltransferase [Parerythrobacter lutipelagi]
MAEIDFPVVGIGASAGGLEALRSLFGGYSGLTGMAFVVVQHLDPTHESLMAQLIERYTAMTISQATGGETVEKDHIYVIPPGHGLALDDGVLELTEFKDPRGMRRPIDDFFESLAEDRRGKAACVILSGTGGDGSRGLRVIKEHGGLCIAQDPETAAYNGMPESAIGTGLVDIVSKPATIIDELRNFFARGTNANEFEEEAHEVTDHIDDLCVVLQDAVGHDFSQYKRTTLTRRIARRMQVLGIESAKEYLKRIREDSDECVALFRDLLINVTRFFRDPNQFAALNQQVIEPLVANARNSEELRVWVPGCSSGEEAYSIAMMFAAAADKHGTRPYVQIFATDIDDMMLDIARSGSYPLSALSDIPQHLRDAYTVGGADRFSVITRIRDMVRISSHNLVRDPPFSKIDLVSCRNLLIYFDEALQKRIIPLFHFALSDEGKLFLGSSETVGRYDDLFDVVDQPSRLFKRRDVKSKYSLQLGSPKRTRRPRIAQQNGSDARPRANGTEIDALQIVAQRYAPVSLLVDQEGTLLERWGSAGRYLDFPERLERNVHVPSLARPGLRELISPLIRQVKESRRRAGVKDAKINTDFGMLEARVVCEPVSDGTYLLVIEETSSLIPKGDDFDDFDVEDGQQKFLEEELQATRHRLRSTVEELETTNEELKSSNEEMMSMNEELQSTNEELTTVNDELKNKLDQLVIANSDLKNFFDSTQLGVLVVDSSLKLRSFTRAAAKIFPLKDEHEGADLASLPTLLDSNEYLALAQKAAAGGDTQETRINASELGTEYFVRAIPYRRLDGELDGATLVITDVTQALLMERDLREERERLRLALEVAKIGVWEYEPETDITVLDATERELLNIPEGEGDTMEPIIASLPPEDQARVNKSLRQAMEGTRNFDEHFRLPLEDGSYRFLHGMGRAIESQGKKKFIGVTIDVSAERALLDQRELMIREMNHRVKNLFSVISAMVSIASREAGTIEMFADDLRGRIFALGRSHSLTTKTDHGGSGAVTLQELVETVVQPSKSEQKLLISGPETGIANSQITSLALILHEWATNATKYGALSEPTGELAVDWTVAGDQVELSWREKSTGENGNAENSTGFGTRLVAAAARQLGGVVEAEAADGRYETRMKFTLDR